MPSSEYEVRMRRMLVGAGPKVGVGRLIGKAVTCQKRGIYTLALSELRPVCGVRCTNSEQIADAIHSCRRTHEGMRQSRQVFLIAAAWLLQYGKYVSLPERMR